MNRNFAPLSKTIIDQITPLLGVISDAEIGQIVNVGRHTIGRYRRKNKIDSISSGHPRLTLTCNNCNKNFQRTFAKAQLIQKKFCSKKCHDAFQKKRDYDRLRYGVGWKEIKEEILLRDQICQNCGRTEDEQGFGLSVHHKLPFRFGGKNTSNNLITLCSVCHRKIEHATEIALSKILVEVTLAEGILHIEVDKEKLIEENLRDS